MVCRVIEGKENSIKNYGNIIEIIIDDFSYLEKPSRLFEKVILNDELFRLINFPQEILTLILDVVINDKDVDYLKSELTILNVPLYSLIINVVNNYKRKYKDFELSQGLSEIIMVCTKDNFIKVLDLSKKINRKISIDGQNISLSEYKNMLDNYDIKSLDNIDIKYQEQNSSVSIEDLYKMALLIDDIVQNIKRFNLSPLEKIIYAYDIVKNREYKESDYNKKCSRDLDKVLQGEAIVCVGYSNFFNALLKCMGFNAVSLISVEKRHQRSVVYIHDDKYKIDGIYAFDPTFDRRKNSSYIDNYKYFAMTMEKSEKDNPSTHKLKPSTSFEELINIFIQENDEIFKDGLNCLNDLEDLFDFVQEDGASNIISVIELYSSAGYEAREIARNLYSKIMKKYKPKEISPSIFMSALLRTRIIEYYTGLIEDFNMDDVIEASKTRTVFQKTNYNEYEDPLLKILDMMDCDMDVYDRLECEGSAVKSDIERDKTKVRLLKVLRNGRK